MYFGNLFFFEERLNLIYKSLKDDEELENRRILDSICFHAFVLMNLFNQISCKNIGIDWFYVFGQLFDGNFAVLKDTFWALGNIFNNGYFTFIIVFEVTIQQLMITAGNTDLGAALIGTASLTFKQQLLCWMLGFLSLIVSMLSRKLPEDWFDVSKALNLEGEGDSPLKRCWDIVGLK